MRVARNMPVLAEKPAVKKDNRRRYGRVRCAGLRCHFAEYCSDGAEVLDLSASGMRLRFRRKVDVEDGAIVNITLISPAAAIRTVARVVWNRRMGFRRHEVGMTFIDPGDGLRAQLSVVMRATSDNHVVYGLNTPAPRDRVARG
jgi:hypothetical protein